MIVYKSKKPLIFTVTLLLLVAVTVVGALAFLVTGPLSIENIFNPSVVTCQVEEGFDGTTKSNVNVKNTGNIDAYIRVKLITYRVNDDGKHIGGTATIPAFTPGDGWVKVEDADAGAFYYYTKPVAPGQKPAEALIGNDGITLQEYTDTDGGKQVIEVMAEAIQAEGIDGSGKKAVVDAWGIDPTTLVAPAGSN